MLSTHPVEIIWSLYDVLLKAAGLRKYCQILKSDDLKRNFVRHHLVSLLLPSGCKKGCWGFFVCILSLDVGCENHLTVDLYQVGLSVEAPVLSCCSR